MMGGLSAIYRQLLHFALIACLILVSGCYLPTSSTERSVASQVLVSVLRCRAEFVAGEIANSSAVDVDILITARWLDHESNVFHEVTMDPMPVAADTTVEWQADAEEEEIDQPQICEAETVEIVESG